MSKKTKAKQTADLSDRLLAFVSGCLGLSSSLPDDRVGTELAEAILKPAVASYFRHGEAEGCATAKEFTQKFRETLGELRIARRALILIKTNGKAEAGRQAERLHEACDELVRAFFQSVRVLENKAGN